MLRCFKMPHHGIVKIIHLFQQNSDKISKYINSWRRKCLCLSPSCQTCSTLVSCQFHLHSQGLNNMEFYFFFFPCLIEGNKVADEKKRSEPLRGLVWGKTSPGSSAVKRGKTRGLRPLLIWSDLVLIMFTRPICLLRGAVSNGSVFRDVVGQSFRPCVFYLIGSMIDLVSYGWNWRGASGWPKVAFQVARRSFYSSYRSSYSNLTAVHVTSTQPVTRCSELLR